MSDEKVVEHLKRCREQFDHAALNDPPLSHTLVVLRAQKKNALSSESDQVELPSNLSKIGPRVLSRQTGVAMSLADSTSEVKTIFAPVCAKFKGYLLSNNPQDNHLYNPNIQRFYETCVTTWHSLTPVFESIRPIISGGTYESEIGGVADQVWLGDHPLKTIQNFNQHYKSPAHISCSPDLLWIMLVYNLAWRRDPKSLLQGCRVAWDRNFIVQFTGSAQSLAACQRPLSDKPKALKLEFPLTRFYSTLAMNVSRASSHAIDVLLRHLNASSKKPNPPLLTTRERTVLEIITKQQPGKGVTGGKILKELNRNAKPSLVISLSTFSSHTLGKKGNLRKHYGVKNRRGVGYYVDNADS